MVNPVIILDSTVSALSKVVTIAYPSGQYQLECSVTNGVEISQSIKKDIVIEEAPKSEEENQKVEKDIPEAKEEEPQEKEDDEEMEEQNE